MIQIQCTYDTIIMMVIIQQTTKNKLNNLYLHMQTNSLMLQ